MPPDSCAPLVDARPHVLMVPTPGQGHLTPFVAIAQYLITSGISVTLVHSARTHSLLAQSGNSPNDARNRSMRIEVVPDGLPLSQDRSSTDSFRDSLIVIRKGVEELLEKLMQEENAPCCLIVDSLFGWGHDVAIQFGLPRIDLWTSTASVFCMCFHLPELVARGYIPASEEGSQERMVDFIPGLSPFRIADLPGSPKVSEDPENPIFQFFLSLFKHVKAADRILANTMYELESSALDAMRMEYSVRIDSVGPLFMLSSTDNAPSSPVSLHKEDTSCLSWLDQQKNSSVLYISFGSFAILEEDLLKELAHGLEASGQSFLWVIRADALGGKASIQEVLPDGFLERTGGRGLIISWAPQVLVLGHAAVGAFLTHCGWNSTMESLGNGVPMIGFPQVAEQNTNLKLIVHEWKVGLPLLKHGTDTKKVERFDVEGAITTMMRGEDGTAIRARAREWKDKAFKAFHGSSMSNLQKLADDIKRGDLKRAS